MALTREKFDDRCVIWNRSKSLSGMRNGLSTGTGKSAAPLGNALCIGLFEPSPVNAQMARTVR